MLRSFARGFGEGIGGWMIPLSLEVFLVPNASVFAMVNVFPLGSRRGLLK